MRVIALGFFDGVHIGHGALLRRTRERATELGLRAAAMSFDSHPDTLVSGVPVPLINSMDDRAALMRRLYGIDDVIFAHFDRAMMEMPWEDFLGDFLVRQHGAAHLVCGHDFRFGYRGQGTPERLREPGGNVARERFAEEVLTPLSHGEKTLSCRRFDCSTQTLLEPKTFAVSPVVLVEGAYSMHPALRAFYDFAAFLSIDPQLQRARILQRNGEDGLRRFEERWIPLENRYFSALGVVAACRFQLTARD